MIACDHDRVIRAWLSPAAGRRSRRGHLKEPTTSVSAALPVRLRAQGGDGPAATAGPARFVPGDAPRSPKSPSGWASETDANHRDVAVALDPQARRRRPRSDGMDASP